MSEKHIAYSTESLIKNCALEIGFSAAGIAAVQPSHRSDEVFERWLAAGMHGEMKYLSGGRDKRHDPAVLLPGARSIISVALNYHTARSEDVNRTAAADGRGLFSNYAHGPDYHNMMSGMLQKLQVRLHDIVPRMQSVICVDTQPVSERDIAIRAGVAWLAKNTMVISPDFGSWIFLGELITDVELRADKPLKTMCGTCTRCLDVCPTGALEDAFVLNANKCISYLTIEKRGEMDDTSQRAIGDHVFGCDECQTVCPFNASPVESAAYGALPTNPLLELSLDDLRRVSDDRFREYTTTSAISRCKASGLRRNASAVARNRS